MSRTTPSFEALPPSVARRWFAAPRVVAGLALLLCWLAVPMAATAANPLDQPRAEGTVGERYDGFAVVRSNSASSDIRNLVKDINAKRKALYEKRAAAESVPVEQVGKIYAREVFKSAPSGTWFLKEDGQWVQK